MDDITGEKRRLRREINRNLERIGPEDVARNEAVLLRAMEGWPRLEVMENLLGYFPFGPELSPTAVLTWWLDGGRALHLPRVAGDGVGLEIYKVGSLAGLLPGYKGIMEPDPSTCEPTRLEEIDVVLVPGLGFDSTGTRLGRGGGHYDRLFTRLPETALRVGVCWEFQMQDNPPLPRQEHDAVMDYLCTPSGLVRCDPGRRNFGG